MKGLKQHIINFEIIPTGNSKTLIFIDSSDYFTEPEKPLLEITLPGYDKYFLVNIVPRKVNTFNSNSIGLTEILNNGKIVDLPDGAYHFRFKVCPYESVFKDKVYFRTTLIEEKLSEIYNSLEDDDCCLKKDKELLHEIVEIHSLIEGAKSVVHKNEKKANAFYKLASSLVDKVLSKFCKSCN
jgi:hypothetical protein